VGTLSKSCLLFVLNGLDAQLTLLWIRLNVASEGNTLMARVLEHGEWTFFGVKIAIGAFAAYILYRCGHLPIASFAPRKAHSLWSMMRAIKVLPSEATFKRIHSNVS
jgi:hypothetical protein